MCYDTMVASLEMSVEPHVVFGGKNNPEAHEVALAYKSPVTSPVNKWIFAEASRLYGAAGKIEIHDQLMRIGACKKVRLSALREAIWRLARAAEGDEEVSAEQIDFVDEFDDGLVTVDINLAHA